MTTKRGEPEPPKIKRFTSIEEIGSAKAKLQKRIEEVRAIDPGVVAHDDQVVRNIEANISKTILDVFGPDSPEYRENQYFSFFRNVSVVFSSDDEVQDYFADKGRRDALALLENLTQRLNEDAAGLMRDRGARVRAAFEGLDLHPRIAEACVGLYQDKHYTDAVLRAALALENYVKEKSGRSELGGTALMEQVFSVNDPVLGFNPLADQGDKDEQRGLMHLFQGAILALRNPRAHKLIQDSPEQALEAIALISLLAKRLEQAKQAKK